ncbi:MAG: DUF2157 domain-containing protein [Kiritimatiellaeota bacterium]|nr:DUF2157 domain-containing protein [Kiritimatiellota bacterium]
MKKNLLWLKGELAAWVSEGIIASDQAEAIRKRYPEETPGFAWGTIIFAGLGGVILGLGVILLFAYNWDQMPRFLKLALIAGVLGIVHAVAIRLHTRSERFKTLGEALGLLGTMIFGAGIFLVAQIYHIDEHFPNAFIIWALGALALAWAMPSIAQGILAAVLVSVWCGSESIAFNASMNSGPLLIVALLGSLAYVKRSRVLLAVLIPAFLASLLFVQAGLYFESGLLFGTAMNIAALLVALGFLARRYGGFPESAPIFLFYGWVAFIFVLYVLTFPEAAKHLLNYSHDKSSALSLAYWIASSVLGLGTWAFLAYTAMLRKHNLGVTAVDYLLPLTVILGVFYMLFKGPMTGWAMAGPFNLVFLALVISMLTRGCRLAMLKPTVIGSILLLVYAFSRYFDLFHSLLERGLVFIVVGALIFGQGILYSRAKGRKTEIK